MTPKQKSIARERAALAAMVKELNGRIDSGVKFLDKQFGRDKWLTKINESILKLDDGGVCVTGQLYDEQWEGFLDKMESKVLRKKLDDFDQDREDADGNTAFGRAENKLHNFAAKLGFFIEDDRYDLDYDILTRLWFNRISELKILSGIPLNTPPPIESEE